MRLASHGTGGARRRMRWHSGEHRPLVFRGRRGRKGEPGEEWLFECHGTDGRTYTLMLDAGDVDALRAAGLERTFQAVLGLGEGRGGNGQIPLLGSRDKAV